MTWYVGGEDSWYEPAPGHDCPFLDAGTDDCLCDAQIPWSAAQDWLTAHGVPAETLHRDEIVAALQEHHEDGFVGWWDAHSAAQASRRLAMWRAA